MLFDSAVTRVHPNGLSETYQQRVVEILDERGAREEAQADIRYTPDTQSVEVRAARVYKRSGEVVEAIVDGRAATCPSRGTASITTSRRR